MENVLRLKKSQRNAAILFLIFFVSVMIGSICVAWANGSLLGLFAFAVFWGFWVVLSVIILIAYYRESLFLDDGKIIQQGILRRREMALADMVSMRWRIWPAGGSVVLRSSTEKIVVSFDNYEPAQKRWLIQAIRLSLPQSIQQDWERFCLRMALPLWKQDTDAPLRPDEILLTRRRCDWFFGVLTVVSAILGAVCAWLLRSPSLLALPLFALPLWPLMRFSTPAKGTPYRKIPASETKPLLFLLIWCVIGVVIVPLSNNHGGLANSLLVVWIAILVYLAYRMDRITRRQYHRREAIRDRGAPAAAEEWERLVETSKTSEEQDTPTGC